MKKSTLYFNLTIIMFLLGLTEAVSGFVLWLAFPSGGGGGGLGRHGGGGGGGFGELTFWGISKHTWIDIHDWVGVALIALVLVHVILHWKWIARMTKSLFRRVRRGLPVTNQGNELAYQPASHKE